MNKKKLFYLLGIVSLFILYICVFEFGKENGFESVIAENINIIEKMSKKYEIDLIVFKSVMYGEYVNNVDVFDETDFIRARFGYDASVGVCQIKISTAMWIEENFAKEYKINISPDRESLIKKLSHPSNNIEYSFIYLRIIVDTLSVVFKTAPSIINIASYYSYGIDLSFRNFTTDYHNVVGDSATSYFLRNEKID